MIIDFHVHAFPDKIASAAISKLKKTAGGVTPVTDGTLRGAKEYLKKSGVDAGVLVPIATKPSQQSGINNWAAENICRELICFGSVHPDYENVEREIQRVKNHGLRGFKFHPDFQGFNIDDDKALKMYDAIGSDYPIVFHTGDENLKFSSPERLSKVMEKFPEHKFVAAHMGGYAVWETEAKSLIGKNVWFDTSSTMWRVKPAQMVKMIREHGADKILFGTDYPAVSLKEEAERIEKLRLTKKEKEAIFWQNAEKLLGPQL